MKITTALAAGAAILLTAGCSSMPRNTGTSYECDRGTRLKVDYVTDGAIVRVNGGRTLVLKSTPSNSGQIYENRTGARLHRQGNEVTWNTALRTAPESCRVVYTPL
ncbi:MAG: MliC family protein [Sphingopyxis sp.]|jgi:membrane-bound inhibitor of C-type lysozyme|uniref:MliC family protein n=1 Tax=Sphingopyxis sp. TaxID=1908224 RepID=UPI0032EF707F